VLHLNGVGVAPSGGLVASILFPTLSLMSYMTIGRSFPTFVPHSSGRKVSPPANQATFLLGKLDTHSKQLGNRTGARQCERTVSAHLEKRRKGGGGW
jgi:hypothetical protein